MTLETIFSLPDAWFQVAETQFYSAVSQPGQRSAKLDSPCAGNLTRGTLTPPSQPSCAFPCFLLKASLLSTLAWVQDPCKEHTLPLVQMLTLYLDFRVAAFAIQPMAKVSQTPKSASLSGHASGVFCQCKQVPFPRKPGCRMKRKGAGAWLHLTYSSTAGAHTQA